MDTFATVDQVQALTSTRRPRREPRASRGTATHGRDDPASTNEPMHSNLETCSVRKRVLWASEGGKDGIPRPGIQPRSYRDELCRDTPKKGGRIPERIRQVFSVFFEVALSRRVSKVAGINILHQEPGRRGVTSQLTISESPHLLL